MLTAVVLFILLIFVLYVYANDTTQHLVHSVNVSIRMVLVLLVVILVLGALIYSFFKFGKVF